MKLRMSEQWLTLASVRFEAAWMGVLIFCRKEEVISKMNQTLKGGAGRKEILFLCSLISCIVIPVESTVLKIK